MTEDPKPIVTSPEEFIGKAELAKRMNKTLRTINNWMSQGLLPYYKIGRSVSFKWSEVEAHLVRANRISPRA